jgi:hypothetical protein
MWKMLLPLISAGVMAIAQPAQAVELPIPVDKAAHFAVSYVITDQFMRMGMGREQAVATTVFIGWAKEITDPQVDPYDLAADALGSVMAGYVRVELHF